MARPPFRYEPLDDSQRIRILTLEPGSGSDPLVGGLGVESLDCAAPQPAAYEAISYVWGTARRCSELVCDGAALPLTQSVHDALVRVRRVSEPRRLWADQVCINQDDVAERSQQVKLMNAVYKNASRVLVWLGGDAEGVAADAVRMVHHLHGVFGDAEAHEAFRVAHSEHLTRQREEPWRPLSKLTKLPWFHRIWIVQEIGTDAPATLYWGDAEMDWDTLSGVAAILNQDYHHLRTRFHIGASNIRYLRRRFVEPDVQYDQYHNRGSFVYELHRARHLHAQDPRDHVYAFLGHFSRRAGSAALGGLAADYARPVADVYVDVAVRDLGGADSLIMLSANHNVRPGLGPAPALGLPSWVPDWRELPLHLLGAPETPHQAAGATKPRLSIDEASRILHIRGVRVDVISRHSWTLYGKAFQFRDDDRGQRPQRQPKQGYRQQHHQTQTQQQQQQQQRLRPIEVLWRHICGYPSFTLSHIYPPYSNGATTTSGHHKAAFFALVQTLTNACIGADRSRPYKDIPSAEWLASGAAYLVRSAASSSSSSSSSFSYPPASSNSNSSSSTSKNISTLDACKPTIASPLSSRVHVSPELRALARAGDPFKWSREAALVTRYRRFAVTSRGYYVLGPDALEMGDVVAVLYGGRTPFILRRAPRRPDAGWLLVGECYVHGLMNAEALTMEGLEEETFSIN